MSMQSSIIRNKEKYDSYFDNSLNNVLKHHIHCLLLGVVTVGFAYPWILCMKQEAKCKHTVICGKRLKFIGNPKELLAHWLFWWLLCVITLGIYIFVVKIRFDQWVTANTIFEDALMTEES